jgi:hypothetical protein
LARHILLVLAAYAAASVAAGFVGTVEAMTLMWMILGSKGSMDLTLLLFVFMRASFYAATFALLPASVAIVHSERNCVHSALFFGMAGALTGIASFVMLQAWQGQLRYVFPHPGGDGITLFAGVIAIVALPGLVAGLVYRAIAGRNAGQWKALNPSQGNSRPYRDRC